MRIISRHILVPAFLTLAAANVFAQGGQVDLLIQNARIISPFVSAVRLLLITGSMSGCAW